MSRTFNGTSDALSYAGAVVTGTPLTMACWGYATATGGVLLSVSNTGSTNEYVSINTATGGSGVVSRANVSGGGSFNNWSSSASSSTSTWFHAALVISSATARTIYHDGSGVDGDGSSITVGSGWNKTMIGAVQRSSGTTYHTGKIACAAIWNVALSAGEVASLAAGAYPPTIQPASLVDFWIIPGFASPEPSLSPGTAHAMTLTGTTADTSNHPAVWTPWRRPRHRIPGAA